MGHLVRSMIEELSQNMNPKDTEKWDILKQALLIYLTQAEIDDVHSMHDIYVRLESKGIKGIANGQCEVLLELFVATQNEECFNVVQTYLRKIEGNNF